MFDILVDEKLPDIVAMHEIKYIIILSTNTRKASCEYHPYHQTSNISRIKSQNLNISLVLQFSLPNPLKSGVKPRMKE